jgi:hypothetical protein
VVEGHEQIVESAAVFLGNDLLAWIVLALGGAMVAGNVLALVRPPTQTPARPPTQTPARPPTQTPARPPAGRDLPRAPLARTALMIVIGAIAAIWALGSLIKG